MRCLYNKIIGLGEFLQTYLLLAFRLYWGFAFFQAGYKKIENGAPMIDFFSSLGIPYAEYMVPVVGWIEVIGGICLLIGLASRLVTIPLIVTMIGALLTAHKEATFGLFQNPQGFINQTPFSYLLISLVVFCFGPGKISMDYLIHRAFFGKK